MLDMSLRDRRIGLLKRLLRKRHQISYAQLGCGLVFDKKIARVRGILSSLTEARLKTANNLGETATEV